GQHICDKTRIVADRDHLELIKRIGNAEVGQAHFPKPITASLMVTQTPSTAVVNAMLYGMLAVKNAGIGVPP
ncbi:MAG: hypothetical protein ACTHKE_01640, partial [Sphingomicrobium sp.]